MPGQRSLGRKAGGQAQKVSSKPHCILSVILGRYAYLPECLAGWTYYRRTRYCYKFYNTAKTWQEARQQCQDIGSQHGGTGELASVHDGQTVNFLVGLAFRGADGGAIKGPFIYSVMCGTIPYHKVFFTFTFC